MRNRRKLILIFLGLSIAGVLLFSLLHKREPRYEGHSLSEWVWSLVSNTTENSSTNAEHAIEQIGTNALPFLIKWVQYEEKPWRKRLGSLCYKLSDKYGDRLNDFVVGRGYLRQMGAFSALYILGPNASPAIPTLTGLIKTQPFITDQCLVVLARIGNDGLSPVIETLTNQASAYRVSAIGALATAYWTNSLDKSLIPVLTNCLQDTNTDVAFCAAQILCMHDSQKELAMKRLIDALETPDKNLRRKAIFRLTASLKRGYSIPALLQFLQDTNSPVSPYAAKALGELAEDGANLPDAVLPALTNSLRDPRPLVRAYSATAVSNFRQAAEPAAPALLELWLDPDEWVRRDATNALFDLPKYSVLRRAAEHIGTTDEQLEMYARRYGIQHYRPALIRLLTDPDIRVRETATNIYRMMRGSNALDRTQSDSDQTRLK